MRVFCECGLSRNVRTFKCLTLTFKVWKWLSGNNWTSIYASALAACVWVCGSSMVRFYEPRSALLSNTWTVMCIYVLSAFLSNSKNEMCQLWSDSDVWARGWLPGNNAEVRNSWEYKVQNGDRLSNWSWKTCFMLSKASGVCLLVFQWVSEGKFGGGCQVFDENYSIASLMKARNLKILV